MWMLPSYCSTRLHTCMHAAAGWYNDGESILCTSIFCIKDEDAVTVSSSLMQDVYLIHNSMAIFLYNSTHAYCTYSGMKIINECTSMPTYIPVCMCMVSMSPCRMYMHMYAIFLKL